MLLSGWGRFPSVECEVLLPRRAGDIRIIEGKPVIPRGCGRSYGDSSLQPLGTIDMTAMNHMLDFDPDIGLLTCEGGTRLDDILNVFVPLGWFPQVTPGTKYVTVGGMIASNVHGKNQHVVGCFCDHLEEMDILLPNGSTITCSRTQNAELFKMTCGGMGLTGIILTASFYLIRIETAYIREERLIATDLADVMAKVSQSNNWTYTVAWIDCLAGGRRAGRSVVYRGEHALRKEISETKQPLKMLGGQSNNVPFDFPPFILNRHTMRPTNAAIYWKNFLSRKTSIVHFDKFFYPLDKFRNWNRVYGKRGLIQYQCVFPLQSSERGVSKIMARIADRGTPSFLAVLKLFGNQDGIMSFPMKGFTLSLDFAKNSVNLSMLEDLDKIVTEYGGRLYLAKDARMGRKMMEQTYPGLGEFRKFRRDNRLDKYFMSRQAERLGL